MARLAQLSTILQGCISWRKPAAKSLLEAAQAKHTRSRCSERDTQGHTELLEESSDSKSKQGLELCQQGCSCGFSQLCRVQGQTGPHEHPVCCLWSGPWHFIQVFLRAGVGSGSGAKPEGRSDAVLQPLPLRPNPASSAVLAIPQGLPLSEGPKFPSSGSTTGATGKVEEKCAAGSSLQPLWCDCPCSPINHTPQQQQPMDQPLHGKPTLVTKLFGTKICSRNETTEDKFADHARGFRSSPPC